MNEIRRQTQSIVSTQSQASRTGPSEPNKTERNDNKFEIIIMQPIGPLARQLFVFQSRLRPDGEESRQIISEAKLIAQSQLGQVAGKQNNCVS